MALLWLDETVASDGQAPRWGRASGTAPIPFEGAGFPLFAEAGQGPEIEYLRGVLPPVAESGNRWVLDTPVWPAGRQDGKRPWAGVSGAAIFARSRLLGVVVEDDQALGWRRLHAEPVHGLFADADFARIVCRHGDGRPTAAAIGVVRAGPAAPASGYLRELTQWARVDDFVGRQKELAEMARFVSGADGREVPQPYWRWLAPAWAGKTTLMAQFILEHLPASLSGVDVLAFFVARRQAGQSDRTAFLAAMQRQLREYLGERDLEVATAGQFLDALERAGSQARCAGRLVLLAVDGLDEDTGPSSAVDGFSIAALLPRIPPAEVRVLVSGRPNPPVPVDVPDRHPLRSSSIDHKLEVSKAADARQSDAERDLRALVNSGMLGRQLVGLTAVAGGGLTSADLAALMEPPHSRREVELVLGGSLGRSFQLRDAQWTADRSGPAQVYSFAHDVLLDSAVDLVSHEVDKLQDRLHAWVRTWQEAGWPPETPEWVLVGYPLLLRYRRDAKRLTALATDQQRHERLWRTTGADAQAYAEIADAFVLQRAAEDPDIAACVRLANRRQVLLRSLRTTPTPLIRAWARIGQVRRALTLLQARRGRGDGRLLLETYAAARTWPMIEQLVGSAAEEMTAPRSREWLLAALVRSFAAHGRVNEAATLARRISDPMTREWALAGAAGALAKAAFPDEAAGMVRELSDPLILVCALADIARSTSLANPAREAARFANGIQDPMQAGEAAAEAAGGLAGAGLAAEALTLVESIQDPYWRVLGLVDVSRTLARADRVTESEAGARKIHRYAHALEHMRLIDELSGPPEPSGVAAFFTASGSLARLAPAFGRPDDLNKSNEMIRIGAISLMAREIAAAGAVAPAVALLQEITDPFSQVSSLAGIAQLLIGRDQQGEAGQMIDECAGLLQQIGDPRRKDRALAGLSQLLAGGGQEDRAEDLVYRIESAETRERALVALSRAWARSGRPERAEELVRGIEDPTRRSRALADAASALARVGYADKAAAMAREIPYAAWAVTALTDVAGVRARAGDRGQALTLVAEATDLAHRIPDPERRAWSLSTIVTAMARAGLTSEATLLAHKIKRPEAQTVALGEVALALAESGLVDESSRLAGEMTDALRGNEEQSTFLRAQLDMVSVLTGAGQFQAGAKLIDGIRDRSTKERASALLATALAASGDVFTAAAITRDLTDPLIRDRTLPIVVRGLIELGDYDQATELVRMVSNLAAETDLLKEVVRALARTGEWEPAVALAHSVAHPVSQELLLLDVAQELAASGWDESAVEVARTKLAPDARDQVLATLASNLAERGELAQASHHAYEISNAEGRDTALAGLIPLVVKAGEHEAAAALARDIGHQSARDNALTHVVSVLAGTGRGSTAVELAEEISASALVTKALADAARTLVETDRLPQANSLADQVPTGPMRTHILLAIATALAGSDQLETAAGVLRRIDDRQVRARGLADLARAWGACAEGRGLLAEALEGDLPWSEELAATVLAVAPEKASVIASLRMP